MHKRNRNLRPTIAFSSFIPLVHRYRNYHTHTHTHTHTHNLLTPPPQPHPPPPSATAHPPKPPPPLRNRATSPPQPLPPDPLSEDPLSYKPKRTISDETRRKISYSMLGVPKSQAMKDKVSAKLRGRVPWNKGKKLSPEVRARMSDSHLGLTPWNKGIRLSENHRKNLSLSVAGQKRSEGAKHRIRMARRRPGDPIMAGNSGGVAFSPGGFPLVEGQVINDFVSLRRELKLWSDKFVACNGRRPTLHDVRRVAPVPIVRKFERYVAARQQIRGLASDVCGDVDPHAVPVVRPTRVARNNNASDRSIQMTRNGNPRLVSKAEWADVENSKMDDLQHSATGMFDMYDTPKPYTKPDPSQHTLIGTHEMEQPRGKDQFCANDYRKIGRYRLMETMDINRYVRLRKELEKWSSAFKHQYGRTPTLSDTRGEGKSMLYDRFCQYLEMRDAMNGLMTEVYGSDKCDIDTLTKANREGKTILNALRSGTVTESELPEDVSFAVDRLSINAEDWGRQK